MITKIRWEIRKYRRVQQKLTDLIPLAASDSEGGGWRSPNVASERGSARCCEDVGGWCSYAILEGVGCGNAGGWLRRRGKLAMTRREAGVGEGGWLQRLQSLAANKVLLVAASGKERSRRGMVGGRRWNNDIMKWRIHGVVWCAVGGWAGKSRWQSYNI